MKDPKLILKGIGPDIHPLDVSIGAIRESLLLYKQGLEEELQERINSKVNHTSLNGDDFNQGHLYGRIELIDDIVEQLEGE